MSTPFEANKFIAHQCILGDYDIISFNFIPLETSMIVPWHLWPYPLSWLAYIGTMPAWSSPFQKCVPEGKEGRREGLRTRWKVKKDEEGKEYRWRCSNATP